jgi:predicted CoA-substrate-specific enzyme activase
MSYYIGIDIGSRNTKLAILDSSSKQLIFNDMQETGMNPRQTADELLRNSLMSINATGRDIEKIYCTGYGRSLMQADKTVSEINCHAQGVLFYFPTAGTIIDIGGQDSKVVTVGSDKHVKDFVMNDKCAAGTGRFLEMVALRLGIGCNELSAIARTAKSTPALNSTCVVFAETEIISLITKGFTPAEIIRAVNNSIANRIVTQVNQLQWTNPVVFTGGVALNHDLKDLLEQELECNILTPPNPEITGALGAALLALRDHA